MIRLNVSYVEKLLRLAKGHLIRWLISREVIHRQQCQSILKSTPSMTISNLSRSHQIILTKRASTENLYSKKSSDGWRALKSEQIERNPNTQPLKLIQDITTCWNSKFHMMTRILKLSDELALVCRKVNHSPEFFNSSEEKIVKDVVNVLGIFEDATKLVSGDQYPTSYLVILVICGLFENLNTIEISLETDVGKMFCSAVRRNMNSSKDRLSST
ncbi:unnamed protein product [Parnassius apollo]|uniref:(apollo) hypothetical protein n=1 Tax=Parnassius apollo TaxID=110799 RepID=A0A8S3WXG2_PARAO|nr:unnamed protein product [Parnassius apollo]